MSATWSLTPPDLVLLALLRDERQVMGDGVEARHGLVHGERAALPPAPPAPCGSDPSCQVGSMRSILAVLAPPSMVRYLASTWSRAVTSAVALRVRRFYEEHHDGIEARGRRRRYFYESLARILRGAHAAGPARAGHRLRRRRPARVACSPSYGVGIDVSRDARSPPRTPSARHGLHFFEGDGADPRRPARASGGPFDAILLVNVVTHLDRRAARARGAAAALPARTRVLIYSYSRLWQPVLRAGGAARPEVPAAAGGLAAARGDREHAEPRGLRGGARRRALIVCPVDVPLVSDAPEPLPRPPAARRVALADVRDRRAARPPHRLRRRRPRDRAERQRHHPLPQRGRAHPAAGGAAAASSGRAASSSSSRATRPTTPRR